jgi:parallel beta-helix repeat protein
LNYSNYNIISNNIFHDNIQGIVQNACSNNNLKDNDIKNKESNGSDNDDDDDGTGDDDNDVDEIKDQAVDPMLLTIALMILLSITGLVIAFGIYYKRNPEKAKEILNKIKKKREYSE